MCYFSIGTLKGEKISSHSHKTGSLVSLRDSFQNLDKQVRLLSMGANREENNLSKTP